MDSNQMVKSAGNFAHTSSLMMALSATSLLHTVEVLVMSRNSQDTRSGELSGTQSAEKTSIMLDAASAHQTALMVWTTLVFLVQRILITEILLKQNL